jgi:hypothetical protein
LIDRLVHVSAAYLSREIAAGAEVVQVFDFWAGVLPPAKFERWCVTPMAAIGAKVKARAPETPIIAFPRGAGSPLDKFASTPGGACIGLDTSHESKGRRGFARNDGAAGKSRPPGSGCWGRGVGCRNRPRSLGFRLEGACLQPRPRHSARNTDCRCRADDAAGARTTTSGDHNDGADPRLVQASAWFRELQTRIVAATEARRVEFVGSGPAREPGRFILEPCVRADPSGVTGGGRRTAMLRGGLFEKIGVHCSTVHGAFPAEFAGQIPGVANDPRFWASGFSLTGYLGSLHVPTFHMNVRLVRTTKTWFGGGADLTPCLTGAGRRTSPIQSLSQR